MSQANWVHAWNGKIWRSGRIFMILWEIFVLSMTTAAAADVTFHLGWGYKLTDVWLGLLMALFGVVFLGFYWAINRLVGRLNTHFYGPPTDLQ
jgi:drug/metabolite transporter (DMT)-like permease